MPRVLTEYERGQCHLAIEWVCRLGKPIAEVGARSIMAEKCENDLAADLRDCLLESHECANAYLIKEDPGLWRYGFYSQPWALDALVSLYREDRAISDFDRRWIAGLLFGYDSVAIQRFVGAMSAEQGSMSRVHRIVGMEEIVPQPTVRCAHRNIWPSISPNGDTDDRLCQSSLSFSAHRLVDREMSQD